MNHGKRDSTTDISKENTQDTIQDDVTLTNENSKVIKNRQKTRPPRPDQETATSKFTDDGENNVKKTTRKDKTYDFADTTYTKYNTKYSPGIVTPGIDSLTTSLLSNFVEYYTYIKQLHSGHSALNTAEGNYALHLNKVIAYLGKASSEVVLDHMKNLFPTNIVTKSTIKQIKTIKPVTMPHLLLNPPPPDYSIYFVNHLTHAFSVEKKVDLYLPNFEVTNELTANRGKMMALEKIEEKSYTPEEENAAIRHGVLSMFEQSIKPRGFSPLQVFLICLLSYRCTTCQEKFDASCQCYLKSPSLWAMLQFVEKGKGSPFFYKAMHSRVTISRQYKRISSMVPVLWYLLAEISVRTSTGLFDENLEGIIVQHYLDFASTKLTGRMMTERDALDAEVNKLLDSPMTSFSIDPNSARVQRIDLLKGKTPVLNFPFWNPTPIDDCTVRRLFSALFYLGHPPMYIHGSMALALERSAISTAPMNFITVRKLKAEVQYGRNIAPYEYDFIDTADSLVREMVEMLEEYAPKIDDIRYNFFSNSTSNSAGVPPDIMASRREALDKDKSLTQEEKNIILNLSKKRIGDVLHEVAGFLNPDAYLNAGSDSAVAGTRNQVDRRPRVIQMVGTRNMLAGYIIANMYKPAIEHSVYTSSGKNAGDVRDMLRVLAATGRRYMCSSNDVAGMDTSTYMDHELMTMHACVMFINAHPELHETRVFLNEDAYGVSKRIDVQVVRNNVTSQVSMSPIEFVLRMHLSPNIQRSLVRDNMFQTVALTSPLTFPSGQFNTSTQHTIIGVAVMRALMKRIPPELSIKSIEPMGSILGDDEFYGMNSPLYDPSEYVTQNSATITGALEEIGYKSDPALRPGNAEFLKLQAVNGMPSPYSNRLTLFASERGDGMDVSPMRRVTETEALIVEFSARIPKPQHTIPLRFAVAYMSSYVKVTLAKASSGVTVVHSTPVIPFKLQQKDSTKGTMSRLGHVVDAPKDRPPLSEVVDFSYETLARGPKKMIWSDSTERDHGLLLLHGLWYCIPSIGLPFPAMLIHENLYPMCSPYYFPSPLTCKLISDLICIPYGIQDMSIRTHNFSEAAYSLSKKLSSRLYGARKLNHAQRYMLFHSDTKFLNPLDVIDVEKDRFFGFSHAFNINKIFKSTPTRIEQTEALEKMQQAANALLNPSRRNASSMAVTTLKSKFGLSVPKSISYAESAATRVQNITRERVSTTDIRLNQLSALELSNAVSTNTADMVILGQFQWKVLHPEKSYRVEQGYYRYGFGSAVPPRSIQAYMMEMLGMPDPRRPSKGFASEMIRRHYGMDIANVVYDFLLEAHVRGPAAMALAHTALQLPRNVVETTERITFGLQGVRADIPYAINPRMMFYFNTDHMALPLHYTGDIERSPFERLLLTAIACAYPQCMSWRMDKVVMGYELEYVSS
jgi:hypothetical protein